MVNSLYGFYEEEKGRRGLKGKLSPGDSQSQIQVAVLYSLYDFVLEAASPGNLLPSADAKCLMKTAPCLSSKNMQGSRFPPTEQLPAPQSLTESLK